MTDSTTLQQPAGANNLYGGLLSAQGLDLDQFETIHTQVQAWKTTAGTDVKFVEARELPIVDVILRFKAGSTQDTLYPGLAALTLSMLDEGSQAYTAAQQAEHLERLGAVMEKQVRLEHATLRLRSLSPPSLLDPALALLTDLVAHPVFHPMALTKIKRQLLQNHASRERLPILRARSEVFRHLFNGHPYGNPLGSTAQGIEAITPEDLRAFHQRAYSASNLEMVVVGDLSLAQAQAISQQISQALPQGWSATELPAAPAAPSATIAVEQAGASSAVLLALPMNVPANDPEFLALTLASAVLGEGLESRLMVELRQRRGLTYGVYTHVLPLSAGGLFTVEWEVAPQHVQGTQALVETLLQAFIDEGPTQRELQLARKQLEGQLLRGIAQNRQLATLLTEVTHQRQPADHLDTYSARIAELTPADVRAVMQRRLALSRKVLVSVGPGVQQQPLPAPDQ
ncbi:pitrilysin family protein [Pseudomonas putida]|jgi:zinc protease|uniref:Peptidase M16 n=1 Tax=Pseudomonas putida TaxID=303 RepID=A0A2S3X1A3_PSEPU|nr:MULTISPECIES: pitrilysin family protein [Pseudomonas]EKT4458934.1 insulinase family protein [Pseudomonas putida]EKT4474042.1 insulinase family protein [Pseudomonas putida]EKT4496994.1 insulinase family protein [Pseudomonas putida]EKT4513238.1 insulinase family protein [Pseudomonas putida]EKT4529323.1 insulinase family protein [Pseudomonas putida]